MHGRARSALKALPERAFRAVPDDARWEQVDIALVRAGGDALESAHALFGVLVPRLEAWGRRGSLHGWFFMRKPPDVRLRLRPAPGELRALEASLAQLRAGGRIRQFLRGRYRPETARFGGPAALELAHAHFHVDSAVWWSLQRTTGPAGQPERLLPVVLHHLFVSCCGPRGALGAWAHLASLTAPEGTDPSVHPPRAPPEVAAMAADPGLDPSVRAALDTWGRANVRLGGELAALAARGALCRPIPEVAATIALFDLNRHGLPGERSNPLAGQVLAALRAERPPGSSVGGGGLRACGPASGGPPAGVRRGGS